MDSNYDQSDALPVFYNTSGGYITQGSRGLILPVPDANGYCDDSREIGFEDSVTGSAVRPCVRLLTPGVESTVLDVSTDTTSFETSCLHQVSLSHVISNVRIGK